MLRGKLLCVLLSLVLLVAAGCGGDGGSAQEAEMDAWLASAQLDAEDSPEALYEAALSEGTLVIFSTTTRLYDVKDSFEAAYPGLSVQIHDTRAYDLLDMLLENYENQIYACDLVVSSDNTGMMEETLLPLHIVNRYVPKDIEDKLLPEQNENMLDFLIECEQLFYNNQHYSEPPIDNWWELTEPQWYGKVYMKSPLRSNPSFALVFSVIQNSDAMAAAYEARYGEPPEIREGSSAGELFWERLVANGVQFTTSSNEVVEIIGAAGQSDPPVGFMISSKVRRTKIGLQVAPAYGALPCDGVYSTNSVMIVGGSKNVNCAKLFIRWMLGETDGTGEGLRPYLQEGSWPARIDVQGEGQVSLDDVHFWQEDAQEVIAKRDDVLAFWRMLQASGADPEPAN